MIYRNIINDGIIHLTYERDGKCFDLHPNTIDDAIAGRIKDFSGPEISGKTANVCTPGKILCVGLNYRAHAENAGFKATAVPTLFSKFNDALAPADAPVELPAWETSYDYEAELVIVIGKTAWNISAEQAPEYIFGYSCGNDMSLRDAQSATTQWLIGKTMPGFAPCGPCIVTADSFNPLEGKNILSYVNGELRQNGSTADMIFDVNYIVSYASKYIRLEPGDLIFTGTPAGVALEKKDKVWLKPGDTVDVVIEGIGMLSNTMI